MNPGFARLIVESGDDRTEVDLAADARLFPAEPGQPAPLLSGQELAVDKVLAVFGRAEARDFVDLMAVESRYASTGSVNSRRRRTSVSHQRCLPRCSVGSGGSDGKSSRSTTLPTTSSAENSTGGAGAPSSYPINESTPETGNKVEASISDAESRA